MSATPDDWTDEQNEVFSRVLAFMSRNQRAFVHPKTELLPAAQWETTCFNAAWFAADVAGNCGTYTIMDGEEVYAAESVGTLQ